MGALYIDCLRDYVTICHMDYPIDYHIVHHMVYLALWQRDRGHATGRRGARVNARSGLFITYPFTVFPFRRDKALTETRFWCQMSPIKTQRSSGFSTGTLIMGIGGVFWYALCTRTHIRKHIDGKDMHMLSQVLGGLDFQLGGCSRACIWDIYSILQW